MSNNEFSLQQSLRRVADRSLENDIKREILFEDEELDKKISDFIKINQANGTTPIATENLQIEKIKEEREKITKFNYHFPDILNAGELIYKTKPASAIVKDGMFKTVPFFLPIQSSGVAFLANIKQKDTIMSFLETSIINLMSSLPNGLVKTILIDKPGSGNNFPNLITLHKKLTETKVLSSDSEIEDAMEGLKNAMSSISQSISANGFSSIEEYNTSTDEVPQQYTILAINAFPYGFNKKATENLIAILESGAKAGIFVFMTINYDRVQGLSQMINGKQLIEIISNLNTFLIEDRPHELILDGLISENVEMIKIPLKKEKETLDIFNNKFKIKLGIDKRERISQKIDILNKDIEHVSLRPIIPFKKALPKEDQIWSKDASLGISVPVAKKGIEDIFFSLGVNEYGETESVHHGLIAGMTGSGKTVLLHDFILMTALYYSPKDVQFYLLDYKKGVEFAMYESFPYVNILSIDAEVEFGLQTLDRAISLMDERDKLFKKYGVGNLNDYNRVAPEEEKLPRIIFIIDEFQVLLPKDHKISSQTNEKIETIVRLARSFGVNFIMSTQTLRGVDLEEAIMSNVPLRIAMTMQKKDVSKIFEEDNDAPKFLQYPGEGIYNKRAGNSKGNVHFQSYFADNEDVEETIRFLNQKIIDEYGQSYFDKLNQSRFIYNGEQKGDLSKNEQLYLAIKDQLPINSQKLYIGEPAGLTKEHIFVEFKDDYAENLIIVGGDQIKAGSIFTTMTKQILLSDKKAKIYFSNAVSSLNKTLEEVFSTLKDKDRLHLITNKNTEKYLVLIYEELLKRADILEDNPGATFDRIYFFNFFINNSKIFNDTSMGSKSLKMILDIIKRGPEMGIFMLLYSADFSKLTEISISRELSKFNKKIALKGGQSIKIFGVDFETKFSKSDHVAIIQKGVSENDLMKFKPYINENLIGSRGNKND